MAKAEVIEQYKILHSEVERIVDNLESQKEAVHSLVRATRGEEKFLYFGSYYASLGFTEQDLMCCIDRLYRMLDQLEKQIG